MSSTMRRDTLRVVRGRPGGLRAQTAAVHTGPSGTLVDRPVMADHGAGHASERMRCDNVVQC
jgi:hypothetical protein